MNDHVLAQHENIKAFQCESCGKYYGSKLILRDHKKTVHGTKKHICDSCGYSRNFYNSSQEIIILLENFQQINNSSH